MSTDINEGLLSIDHLSDEHYRLIGRAVIAWSHVEEGFASLLTRSLLLDARQGLALKQTIKNYNAFASQICAIWKATNEDIFNSSLKPIIDESKSIYEIRNKFSHRPWYSDGYESMFSFDGKYTNFPFATPDFLDVEVLKNIPARCEAVVNRLTHFWDENRGLMLSSRYMHWQ